MEELLLKIIGLIRAANEAHESATPATPAAATPPATTPATPAATSPGSIRDKDIQSIISFHNRGITDNSAHFAKKQLLPYYLQVKREDRARWQSWQVDAATERQLTSLLKVKPRRTTSGVATISVITKPWPCAGNCLYCPNDLRMPKSYLSDEPACQRAERNYFDPYLQVASRLQALVQMGHGTDKIELIVLGGSFSDYPLEYQIWFVSELFRALNEDGGSDEALRARQNFYQSHQISNQPDRLAQWVHSHQQQVNAGRLTYNQAVEQLYGADSGWSAVAAMQTGSLEELTAQQRINETAAHRVVGLAVETRPEAVHGANLTWLRLMGCTKIQFGIQSLNSGILHANNRHSTVESITRAFEQARRFGFKTHVHFMLNLYLATGDSDRADYRTLVDDPRFSPDEVKLYPCSLIAGTGLEAHYQNGTWQPYDEQQLIDILVADVLATPAFIRISRMIRDFTADDILVGNRKTNLRQMVERQIEQSAQTVQEIRYREIGSAQVDMNDLHLNTIFYDTSNTREYFLQWITEDNRIAGFLRLSLPRPNGENNEREPGCNIGGEAPVMCLRPESQTDLQGVVGELHRQTQEILDTAMIREVHVYGQALSLHTTGDGVQHLGLGRQLIAKACDIARACGFDAINVISAVGTRQYYRNLGFEDCGLYQRKVIVAD